MLLNYIYSVFQYWKSFLDNGITTILCFVDEFMQKYVYAFSYVDLLVEISESFGLWIAIVVLFLASLVLSTFIQQYKKPLLNNSQLPISKPLMNKHLTVATYKHFFRNKTRL